jgi:hypothetical protein
MASSPVRIASSPLNAATGGLSDDGLGVAGSGFAASILHVPSGFVRGGWMR